VIQGAHAGLRCYPECWADAHASSVGVVSVHSSSRGSACGLAPDVGGEHVGLLGGGPPVGRWAFAGRARIRRLGGHALLTALFPD
jgi:hypothetical protein